MALDVKAVCRHAAQLINLYWRQHKKALPYSSLIPRYNRMFIARGTTLWDQMAVEPLIDLVQILITERGNARFVMPLEAYRAMNDDERYLLQAELELRRNTTAKERVLKQTKYRSGYKPLGAPRKDDSEVPSLGMQDIED